MQSTGSAQQIDALKFALEDAAIAVHLVGADGRVIWANRAELAMLGYEAHEYLGHPIAEFHADAKVIHDILRRLAERETLRDYPARLLRKDGSIRHVEISSNVLWESEKFLHTRCFTRDVTEQRVAQENVLALSAPILEIDDRLLLLPLIGTLDRQRVEVVTQRLLAAVREHRARAVVLDLTGIAEVDAYVSSVLLNLHEACKLLGAKMVISGVSPQVATQMVRLHLQTQELTTVASLREGTLFAQRLIGRAIA